MDFFYYNQDILDTIIKNLDLRFVVTLSKINKFFSNITIINQIRKIIIPADIKSDTSYILNIPEMFMLEACRKGDYELFKYMQHHKLCRDKWKFLFGQISLNNSQTIIAKEIFDTMPNYNLISNYISSELVDLECGISFDNYKFKNPTYNTINPNTFMNEVIFDSKNVCSLSWSTNNHLLTKLYLSFVLPNLPVGFRWKSDLIYKLIDEISITIGGSEIIRCKSAELASIDKINERAKLINVLSTYQKNKIYYPIDLSLFFGKIHSTNLDLRGKCGILLAALQFHNVKINVLIGKISDCVDGIGDINYQSSMLSEIKLLDSVILAKSHRFNNHFADINSIITQDITNWLNIKINIGSQYEIFNRNINSIDVIYNIDINNFYSDYNNHFRLRVVNFNNVIDYNINELPITIKLKNLSKLILVCDHFDTTLSQISCRVKLTTLGIYMYGMFCSIIYLYDLLQQ